MGEEHDALEDRFEAANEKLWMVRQVRGRADSIPPDGDGSYFVGALVDQGVPLEEAVRVIEDRVTLFIVLHVPELGLEAILADSHAAGALRRLLTQADPNIWRALGEYVAMKKPRRKPGPRPKEGRHYEDLYAELKAAGLSYGQIAKKVRGDPSKRNLVAAALSQRKKKQSARRGPRQQ